MGMTKEQYEKFSKARLSHLHTIKSPIDFTKDSFPCVVIPDYVKDELIATLQGEW